MFAAVALLWVVPLLFCILCFVTLRPGQSRGRVLVAGIGWLTLWSILVSAVQFVWASTGQSAYSFSDWGDRLAFLYWPWSVHLGGWTVTKVFEATVLDLFGSRQSMLVDHLPYHGALVLTQVLVLAAVFTRRYRRTGSLRDPVIWSTGLFILLNGLLNLEWPWWGT